MKIINVLELLIIILIFIVLVLLRYVLIVKRKLNDVSIVLDDIEKGNRNRKILSNDKDKTAEICYKINKIVQIDNNEIMRLQESDRAYRHLLTNISHDVRTPLASLIGYLDAVYNKIVEGEEKEEYIEIARNKSYKLKEFIDMLFEWFKINSNEKTFCFERIDINELTRSIIAGWIPVFDQKGIRFNIDIPDTECEIQLDVNSYSRIVNNIIQNSLTHSGCSLVEVKAVNRMHEVEINISDNGKGIDKADLPYIFDRLYKCDKSRSGKGNGLGLAIVKELVTAHHGSISALSNDKEGITFSIKFSSGRSS